ncbi:DUF6241 domain-containing protein [Sutcliffiella cohnii]|nr:DUF6241 domain-containing protein [Sutcliffiella cohnii]
MKGYLKWLAVISLPIILIVISLLFLTDIFTPKSEVQLTVEESEQGAIFLIEEEKEVVEGEFTLDMSEASIQRAIHLMSHQKVKADQKWGAIPLSPERVERLLEIVQLNRDDYAHADVYESILIRWSKQDFSRADHDHNAIWKLQNGTVGKATGLLTAEEEEAFIRKHFKSR